MHSGTQTIRWHIRQCWITLFSVFIPVYLTLHLTDVVVIFIFHHILVVKIAPNRHSPTQFDFSQFVVIAIQTSVLVI